MTLSVAKWGDYSAFLTALQELNSNYLQGQDSRLDEIASSCNALLDLADKLVVFSGAVLTASGQLSTLAFSVADLENAEECEDPLFAIKEAGLQLGLLTNILPEPIYSDAKILEQCVVVGRELKPTSDSDGIILAGYRQEGHTEIENGLVRRLDDQLEFGVDRDLVVASIEQYLAFTRLLNSRPCSVDSQILADFFHQLTKLAIKYWSSLQYVILGNVPRVLNAPSEIANAVFSDHSKAEVFSYMIHNAILIASFDSRTPHRVLRISEVAELFDSL